MKLLLSRHLWGVPGSWEPALRRFKEKGYGAIDTPLPRADALPSFLRLLEENGLSLVAQVSTWGKSVDEHLARFKTQLLEAAAAQPLLINSHSGSDAWDEDEACRFFEGAESLARDLDIPVAHETHRSRILFHPKATARILKRFPDLRLTCDFSHWVCVCERIPNDMEEVFRLCAERALHVHARVGHEEGPQVPDPRAPEWAAQLAAHERWWDWIWEAQRKKGRAQITLTPEFGPPPYLPTLPYTRAPVADLEEICEWMAFRQRDRFAAQGASPGLSG